MRERWWLAAGARGVLGDRADLSVAGWMQAAAAGDTLSTDRDSAAVRLDGPAGSLLVKWRAAGTNRRWRWWIRPSRERCEARGLLAARRCGIGAPEPLAVGERRDGLGRLVGSVLVRPFVAGTTVQSVLAASGGSGVEAVARALRAWHDAGFRHGDCWPKNLLVTAQDARVLPIGAPKACAVVAGPGLDRARSADLARFAAGLKELWPHHDPSAWLDYYVEGPPALQRDLVKSRVRRLFMRVREKRAEDERTRPTREPNGPPQPVPLPPDARAIARVVVGMERLKGV